MATHTHAMSSERTLRYQYESTWEETMGFEEKEGQNNQ